MNTSADAFIATQKANVEALAGLSQTGFAGFEKLVELNMAASKAVLTESFTNLQALMAAKDPQAMLAWLSSLAQPLAEKSASYRRHLYEIASGTGTELSDALKSMASQSQKAMSSLLETALKDAPLGFAASLSVSQTAIKAGSKTVEAEHNAPPKQAQQLIESSVDAGAPASPKAE